MLFIDANDLHANMFSTYFQEYFFHAECETLHHEKNDLFFSSVSIFQTSTLQTNASVNHNGSLVPSKAFPSVLFSPRCKNQCCGFCEERLASKRIACECFTFLPYFFFFIFHFSFLFIWSTWWFSALHCHLTAGRLRFCRDDFLAVCVCVRGESSSSVALRVSRLYLTVILTTLKL